MKKALNDFPEYRAAQAKLTELRVELNAVDKEFSDGTEAFNQQQALRASDRLTKEAMALIDGEAIPQPTSTQERLNDLEARRRVLLRAVQLQVAHIDGLRAKLSKEICAALRPQYKLVVRELVQKAIALAHVAEKEIKFRDELFQGDISYAAHIIPVPLRGLGRLNDPNSRINQLITEAIRDGYLTEAEREVFV